MSDVLVICTKFGETEASRWLSNDLATELAAQGQHVRVLHLDWTKSNTPGLVAMADGVQVFNLHMRTLPAGAPRVVQLLWKWFFTRFLIPFYVPAAWKKPYDLVIGFSPAIATRGISRFFTRHARRSYVIYWDFFPTHQQQLGIVPRGWLGALAYRAEQKAVQAYNMAGCMSPANMDFFRQYFPRFSGQVTELPVWGPNTLIDRSLREALRAQHGFAPQDVVCVFGGQLIVGRGIEAICELADAVASTLPHVRFVIAGGGALEGMVRARAEASPNLRYLGALSRSAYGELLVAGDIGLVFTPEINVPTFPSKTVDYLRAGLPILASVESATDYRTILQERMGAGLGSVATDQASLLANLRQLALSAELREACGARGQAYYLAHMTAQKVVEKLLAQAVH